MISWVGVASLRSPFSPNKNIYFRILEGNGGGGQGPSYFPSVLFNFYQYLNIHYLLDPQPDGVGVADSSPYQEILEGIHSI